MRGNLFFRNACGVLALLAFANAARAFTIAIAPAAPKSIYLQIGVGTFSPAGSSYAGGNGTAAGTAGNNTSVNRVYVNVPLGAVGNGTAQAMATDSAIASSSYDGRAFCVAGTQVYVGAFYRTTTFAATTAALLTATVPASLLGANGATIPFASISWTSSGIGDSGIEVFAGGTFVNGGSQSIGSVQTNRWAESCWSFSYRNNTVPPPGIYTGRVTYTLVSP